MSQFLSTTCVAVYLTINLNFVPYFSHTSLQNWQQLDPTRRQPRTATQTLSSTRLKTGTSTTAWCMSSSLETKQKYNKLSPASCSLGSDRANYDSRTSSLLMPDGKAGLCLHRQLSDTEEFEPYLEGLPWQATGCRSLENIPKAIVMPCTCLVRMNSAKHEHGHQRQQTAVRRAENAAIHNMFFGM